MLLIAKTQFQSLLLASGIYIRNSHHNQELSFGKILQNLRLQLTSHKWQQSKPHLHISLRHIDFSIA
jgi:hypothetical protein